MARTGKRQQSHFMHSESTELWPNLPVNSDARVVPGPANDGAARAGYRER
jgi:hypothetical protein